MEAGELAQQLRPLVTLAEDPGSHPSTNMGDWLTVTSDSQSQRS